MARIQSKEVLMDDGSGRQYHIHCKKGDVGKYVLLPGDPFRTDIIAKHFDDPHLVAHNREHKTWSGYLDGELVSVCSTGMGGTTVHYIPIEYPAIADREVTNALVKAAKDLGYPFAEGIAQSKDSFYGQHDPDSMPDAPRLHERWQAWERAGVMASEMETSTLFVVAAIRGVKSGAIMAYGSMNDHTIEIACQAIKNLIKADKEK